MEETGSEPVRLKLTVLFNTKADFDKSKMEEFMFNFISEMDLVIIDNIAKQNLPIEFNHARLEAVPNKE